VVAVVVDTTVSATGISDAPPESAARVAAALRATAATVDRAMRAARISLAGFLAARTECFSGAVGDLGYQVALISQGLRVRLVTRLG
jgi:hypothetical protein